MSFQRVGLKREEPVRHQTLLRRRSMTPDELENKLFWGGWYGIQPFIANRETLNVLTDPVMLSQPHRAWNRISDIS
jgi:hypothetical protein